MPTLRIPMPEHTDSKPTPQMSRQRPRPRTPSTSEAKSRDVDCIRQAMFTQVIRPTTDASTVERAKVLDASWRATIVLQRELLDELLKRIESRREVRIHGQRTLVSNLVSPIANNAHIRTFDPSTGRRHARDVVERVVRSSRKKRRRQQNEQAKRANNEAERHGPWVRRLSTRFVGSKVQNGGAWRQHAAISVI